MIKVTLILAGERGQSILLETIPHVGEHIGMRRGHVRYVITGVTHLEGGGARVDVEPDGVWGPPRGPGRPGGGSSVPAVPRRPVPSMPPAGAVREVVDRMQKLG